MAFIKIRVKIGDHESEIVKIDDFYDEERVIYTSFKDAFIKFQNDLREFRYSVDTPHHKTKKIEDVVIEEDITYPEVQERIRLLLREYRGDFRASSPISASLIKDYYKKDHGCEFPKKWPSAITWVLKEEEFQDIYISNGELRIKRKYFVTY